MIYTLTLNPGLDRTLTVPDLVENGVLRATTTRLDWGGKGFNVSRALQALGIETMALGIVGGFTGQMLAHGLASLGIVNDLVQIQGETRTNTVIEEAHSHRYIKVNEAGPLVDEAALAALSARVAALATRGNTWALCGSLPPGTPSEFYATLIELIQSKGSLACLDASGEALRRGVEAAPFLVKPNAEEASELAGIPVGDAASAVRAATHFLERGVPLVAITLGADGLVLATRDQIIHARPPAVAVRTLVGVGDAALAGLLYALERGLALPDVARWGVAAGTAAAMTAGVGVSSLAQVTELVTQISSNALY